MGKGWEESISSSTAVATNPLRAADSIQRIAAQLGDGYFDDRGEITVDAVSRLIRDVNGEVIPGTGLNVRVRDYMALSDGISLTDKNKSQFTPDDATRDTIVDVSGIVDGADHFLVLRPEVTVDSEAKNRKNFDRGVYAIVEPDGNGAPDLLPGDIVTAKINIPVSTTQVLTAHIDQADKKFLFDIDQLKVFLEQKINDAIVAVGQAGLINEINIAKAVFRADANETAAQSDLVDGFSDVFKDTSKIDLGASSGFVLDSTLQVIKPGGTIPAGLQGHWKLNEGSGLVALDSANAFNGVHDPLISGPTYVGPGGVVQSGFGTALDFDGSQDNVILPDVGISENYPFTVSAWVKPEIIADGTIYAETFTSEHRHFLHIFVRDTGKFGVVMRTPTVSNVVVTSSASYTAGTWVHVAWVSASATDHKLYIDAVLDTTVTSNQPNPTVNLANIGVLVRPSISFKGVFMNGIIDDVSVFNTALSATNISNIQGNGAELGAGTGSAIIQSISTTALSSPTKMEAIFDATAGVVIKGSRDGGTTFVTLANKTVFTFGGEPAGTSMVIRADPIPSGDQLDNYSLYWKL